MVTTFKKKKTLITFCSAMCKSSTLAFVLIFAFIFKLEKPSWKLILIIVIITAGVVLMVSDETDFNLVGFIQVMAASAFGGLRWSLTEVLLRKESMGLTNPFASIFFLAPSQAIILLIISAGVEGYITIFSSAFFKTFGEGLHTVSL
jgi:solute carrier family 35 protein C2